MISFVDNWLQPFSLSASATEGAIDLPQGIYVLTVADSETAATRWEILDPGKMPAPAWINSFSVHAFTSSAAAAS